MDMDLVVIISGIFLITVGYNLSRAFAQRMENRKEMPPELADISRRLDAIEQAVETIAIEVERTGEANRFVAQLLAQQNELRAAALPAPKLPAS